MRVLIARLILANRELRGVRTPLIRLISSSTALLLSMIGIPLTLAGFYNAGLVIVMLTTALLAVAMGLSAISTLKTMAPIFQGKR